MTKEELYKEFLEVTHFDESVITRVEYLTRIKNYSDEVIASGFEGLAVWITCNQNRGFWITYFHKKEATDD